MNTGFRWVALLLINTCTLTPLVADEAKSLEPTSIEELQQQRIAVLEEHVLVMEALILGARDMMPSGLESLYQAKTQLIEAKLELAKTAAEETRLLTELLRNAQQMEQRMAMRSENSVIILRSKANRLEIEIRLKRHLQEIEEIDSSAKINKLQIELESVCKNQVQAMEALISAQRNTSNNMESFDALMKAKIRHFEAAIALTTDYEEQLKLHKALVRDFKAFELKVSTLHSSPAASLQFQAMRLDAEIQLAKLEAHAAAHSTDLK